MPAQVLFKMDKAGDGQVVELEDLCMNRELSFVGFTPQMFMEVGPAVCKLRLAVAAASKPFCCAVGRCVDWCKSRSRFVHLHGIALCIPHARFAKCTSSMCTLYCRPDLIQVTMQQQHCCACCLQTCIMAGCDFVKALPGIGIRKAHGHMRRLRSFVKVLRLMTTCVACQYNPPVAIACRRVFEGGIFCTSGTVSAQSLSCCCSVGEVSDLSMV